MLYMQRLERRLLQFWLLLGDGIGLLVSFVVAQMVRFGSGQLQYHLSSLFEGGRFLTVYLVFVFSHYIFDLYEPRHWRSSLYSPLKIIFASVNATLLLFAWFYFVATETRGVYGRGVLMGAISGFTIISLALRFFVDRSQKNLTKRRAWLLLGKKDTFDVLNRDWARIKLGGHLEWHNWDHIGSDVKSLDRQLEKDWDGLIVDNTNSPEISRRLMQARLSGQPILSIQNFYEFHCGKVPLHSLDDTWFAFTEGFSIIHSQISSRLKRITDIIISTIMLIVFAPIMVVLALLIIIESRGPAFYSQVRVGRSGKKFVMWKFRSMKQDAEFNTGPKWAAQQDTRTTKLGRIMRKVRLDELPQLWNILKGEMSFIGPRPERPEFTEQLRQKISFYDLRHLVKPGLTGWAQVMYPYGASEEDAYEKLQYDLFYIKNYSFGLDIEIILKTISVVLFGAGR